WERSVAGLALDALRNPTATGADEPTKAGIQISPGEVLGLIQDAKLFLEADKLDQAEGLLDEILKVKPGNQEANKYWNLLQEKRKGGDAQASPKSEITNTPLSQFTAIKRTNRDESARSPLQENVPTTARSANSKPALADNTT